MAIVNIGTPPKEWEVGDSHFIRIHHFASLSSKKDRAVMSPPFSLFGNEWRLHVYPGGRSEASTGMVSMYLELCSECEFSCRATLTVQTSTGDMSLEHDASHMFTNGELYGCKNYTRLKQLIHPSKKILENGTLTLRVQIAPDEGHHCKNFIPKNQLDRDWDRKLFNSMPTNSS